MQHPQTRLPRIMVICGSRVPSVDLGVIIPLTELQKRRLCVFQYRDESKLELGDIVWCDILFVVRGVRALSVEAVIRAKNLNRLVLCYWDDDLLCIPSHNPNFNLFSNPKIKNNIQTIFKLADAFYSPNPRLAEKLKSHHVCQAYTTPGVCGIEPLRRPKPTHNSVAVVGFAGTAVNIGQMDALLVPAIAGAAAGYPHFKVDLVGAEPRFVHNAPVSTNYTPLIPDYYEYLAFAAKLNWDIGLAPQVECEFTSHKFYNKLIEYTHIGCAGIYSKLEPYNSVIQDGITGLLVVNEVEAWKDAILRLLKDSELRFKIASNAYEFVYAHHNRTVITEKYITILTPFLTHRAPGVNSKYLVTHSLSSRVKVRWRSGIEYIQLNGSRRFVLDIARHIGHSIKSRIIRRVHLL